MTTDGIGVLVGVDESACSQQALTWGAADAAARWRPLTIATVVEPPHLPDELRLVQLQGAAELAARRRVDDATATARNLAAGCPVEGRVLTGDPATELLRLAAGADEVVVGSHGTGMVRLLIGSVSSRVAEHAPCPAVVVRRPPADSRVVVGVDNPAHGEAALEYAFGYADRRGVPLVALHVCTLAAVSYPDPSYAVVEELARIRDGATRAAEQSVARWAQKYPEVDVRVEVADGGAAGELVEASRTAGLLVVGTRGRGGLVGMLLGSVSQAVLRHAHCPVVVAR